VHHNRPPHSAPIGGETPEEITKESSKEHDKLKEGDASLIIYIIRCRNTS